VCCSKNFSFEFRGGTEGVFHKNGRLQQLEAELCCNSTVMHTSQTDKHCIADCTAFSLYGKGIPASNMRV
jgi:hypothetical protein